MANNRYQQKPPIEQVIVESIFRGLFALITWPFRRGKKAGMTDQDRQEIEFHWQRVTQLASASPTVAQAISEADKILDFALQKHGFAGSTMGERLKSANGYFSPAVYQQIWDAHKLRNRLAHDVGVTVQDHEAREAITAFRRALDNL